MGFYDRIKRTARAMRLAWSSPAPVYQSSTSEKGSPNRSTSATPEPSPPAYEPLHPSAATAPHTDVKVSPKLNPRVDINTKDKNGYTPLLYAAQKGKVEVVKRLLETEGIDVNTKDKYGISALSWAARKGNMEIVELFLKAPGVETDGKCLKGRTPLFRAAMKGHVKVVERLIRVPGVVVEFKDEEGSTPFSLASEHGHVEVVNLLLSLT